tara:strand:+ start:14816 stop:15463 length:648 start_codon:yes stop_codon:yes gene_type:complete
MVRPRYSEVDNDAIDLLNKAQKLLKKAEKLQMVEHDGKKVPHFAADGVGDKDAKKKGSMAEKDKYCMKNFGKKYSECSDKQKSQCDKAHGKVEKGKGMGMCSECGEMKMDMEKGMCMKMGCGMKKYGEMKKASPNFITTFSTEPQDVTFVAESGGQTRNAYYTSNQHLLDSEDVANKGATSYAYNLDTLSPTVNTHDRPLESHEITSGGESKTNE